MNIRVHRNFLGEELARTVLELVKSGEFKRHVHELKKGYSCSYSRCVDLENHPVIRDLSKRAAKHSPGSYSSSRVYRMDEGDHFLTHSDLGEHGVYYFSEGWEEDWGGVLLSEGEKFVPEFDALAFVAHGRPHSVSHVTNKAKSPRYTILIQC
jgi:Rps23 Pro-64 3,4-dihydroxylase Tpa1-like proline 4-hydroxylase